MNGKWNSEAKGSWTAIGRAPWLKAVSLYAKGDCWNGGGLFIDDKVFWLNDGYGHERLFDCSEANLLNWSRLIALASTWHHCKTVNG